MVKAQFEPLSYLLMTGLSDLAFECWCELENQHDQEYSPDWEAYQQREDNEGLRFISLRDDDKLIGYISVVIENDRHRLNILVGYFNDIFVTKQKRGYAAFLMKYAENMLSVIGVKRIVAAERLNLDTTNNAGRFYEQLGYTPQERVWSKILH